MIDNVLIGFDGSEESQDAVAFGADLARACGAKITLVASFPVEPELDTLLWVSLEDRGEALLGPVREGLGALCTETRAMLGEAPDALARAAVQLDADVIVVGSTHRGQLGRILFGSTARRLVHVASTPVVVVPRGRRLREPAAIGSLLIADDDSLEARAAAALADEMAKASGARLVDIRITGEGDPVLGLIAAADGVDLMLLGSRGYGRMRGTLLGSVSTHLIRTLPCPLLIVPTKAVRGSGAPEGIQVQQEASS